MPTYRAAMCVDKGKPLEIRECPQTEELKANQVRITCHASVVNQADIERCRGQCDEMPDLPFVPGAEAAGVVAAVGSEVDNVKVGDRVVALNYGPLGCMAEQVVASSERVFKIPDNLTFTKAAGATASYSAAIAALEQKARVEKGDFVLVTGSAGARGIAMADAAQNLYGCKVITLGRGEACTFLQERGFERIIDTSESDIAEKVMEFTEGQGVRLAIDVSGGDTLVSCLKSLAVDGIMMVVGFSSGNAPDIPTDLIKERSLTVMGLNWKRTEQVPTVMVAAKEGKIDPYICKEFPLDQINEAYQMVWDRKSMGKVVVRMRED